MAVDWTDNFICSKCNTSKKVVRVLEEGIDRDTNISWRIIEMDCGHTERMQRVSKKDTLRWLINRGEKVEFEPIYADGTPSMAVSGGSQTTILPAPINIDLEGAKNNTFFMNITTSQIQGDNNFIQNLSKTDANITYNEILKEIPDESERQAIKNMLEEIINKIESKQIPKPELLQNLDIKLKRYEKAYNIVMPMVLKGMDFIKFFCS